MPCPRGPCSPGATADLSRQVLSSEQAAPGAQGARSPSRADRPDPVKNRACACFSQLCVVTYTHALGGDAPDQIYCPHPTKLNLGILQASSPPAPLVAVPV